MYEGQVLDFWEPGGVYSAQQPYMKAHAPTAAQQEKGAYGKGGYPGGKGKYQGGKAGFKGKGKGEGKGGYGTPGSGAYGGCFRCAQSTRWSKHTGAMLHKVADCAAYWLVRDPADMALHTEDAVYYHNVADGEGEQDGDCKHNRQLKSKHLTHRDDRVEPVGSQTHSQEIYAIMSEETKVDTKLDTNSADRKGQVLVNTAEKPLTQVRQEEHDELDQTAENTITKQEGSASTTAWEETRGGSMAHMNLCGNSNAGEVKKKDQDDETERVSEEKEDEVKRTIKEEKR